MWAGRRTSKGKRSMRRDRANQLNPESLQARVSDLNPTRVSPYGPAAPDSRNNRPDRREHLTACTPSRSKKVLASSGASIDGFIPVRARCGVALSTPTRFTTPSYSREAGQPLRASARRVQC